MGNRQPSATVQSLQQVQLREVDNFESWAYWSRLSRLACFKHTHLQTDEDFHTVVVFLQMGNFTAADGSLRRYHLEELEYAGGSLHECRERVTAFVKLTINILISHKQTERSPIGKAGADSAASAAGSWRQELSEADETLLLKALKSLVGNKTWDLHGHDPAVFHFIHNLAVSMLHDIADRGERNIFPKYRGVFSDIAVPPSGKHRLDDAGVLPFKTLRDHLLGDIAGMPPHDHEFMVILEYLAKLVDPFFQFAARTIAQNHGAEWRAAPPKTCARMAAKLSADHADETWPKTAANIDMSRCAMTFASADDLKAAFRDCMKRNELVVLRCKNKLSEDYDAVKHSFGYRSLMANMLLKLPVTWGDLIAADTSAFLPRLFSLGQEVLTTADGVVGVITRFRNGFVRLEYPSGVAGGRTGALPSKGPRKIRPAELLQLNQEMVADTLEEWRRAVPRSLKHLKNLDQLVTRLQFTLLTNKAFLSAPARFIVEIQFLLQDYLRMRKRSHIWYKLYRTENINNLVSDFYSYAGINRASSFLLEGLKQRDARVLRYFARCRDLAPPQVYLELEPGDATPVAPLSPGLGMTPVRMMRDNETGNTVVHYFASAADRRGRYHGLLERVLALPGISLDDLDSEGRTPYTLAKESGNEHIQRRLAAHRAFGARSILNLFYHATGGDGWAITGGGAHDLGFDSDHHLDDVGYDSSDSRFDGGGGGGSGSGRGLAGRFFAHSASASPRRRQRQRQRPSTAGARGRGASGHSASGAGGGEGGRPAGTPTKSLEDIMSFFVLFSPKQRAQREAARQQRRYKSRRQRHGHVRNVSGSSTSSDDGGGSFGTLIPLSSATTPNGGRRVRGRAGAEEDVQVLTIDPPSHTSSPVAAAGAAAGAGGAAAVRSPAAGAGAAATPVAPSPSAASSTVAAAAAASRKRRDSGHLIKPPQSSPTAAAGGASACGDRGGDAGASRRRPSLTLRAAAAAGAARERRASSMASTPAASPAPPLPAAGGGAGGGSGRGDGSSSSPRPGDGVFAGRTAIPAATGRGDGDGGAGVGGGGGGGGGAATPGQLRQASEPVLPFTARRQRRLRLQHAGADGSNVTSSGTSGGGGGGGADGDAIPALPRRTVSADAIARPRSADAAAGPGTLGMRGDWRGRGGFGRGGRRQRRRHTAGVDDNDSPAAGSVAAAVGGGAGGRGRAGSASSSSSWGGSFSHHPSGGGSMPQHMLSRQHFLLRSVSNPKTDPQNAADGWLAPIPLGQWRGVVARVRPGVAGAKDVVLRLHLCHNSLAGSIPSELAMLSQLRSLRLAGNELTGTVPTQLGSLLLLETLDLSANELRGEVPSWLGRCGSLRRVDLSRNKLVGKVPEIGNPCAMVVEELYLHGNELTGPVPAALARLAKLSVLSLRDNQLTGVVPHAALAQLKGLRRLDLVNPGLTAEDGAAAFLDKELPLCRYLQL